ncbi:hypothetical protein GCM10023185_09360 [Hymenobacter saemangeumensis]|uniref:Secretion system C-terminal sorting domain-containing protein n=1 Tax=Hymenobacter saemangeumensis TaxID=1084522 RepID=A0ABP8I483_9BACT
MNKPLLCLLLAPLSAALAQQPTPINLQPGAVITLPAGAAPSALAVADFNQDGQADIAVCQRGLNSVGVYLQASGVTFPNPAVGTYPAGTAPTGLVAVPLGHSASRPSIDLVAASGPSSSYTLLTNNNNGTGTFTPVSNGVSGNFLGYTVGAVSPQLLAYDLDSNGWADFVFTHDVPNVVYAGAYWERLMNSTRLSSTGPQTWARPGYLPSSVAISDFNRDGFVDVVQTNPRGHEFTVTLSAPSASGPSWSIATNVQRLPSNGLRPVFVATGDVNGDLLPDIALAHETSQEITLFLNTRTTQFIAPAAYPLSGAPRQVLLKDLNNDNRTDMVVVTADGWLQVFENSGSAGVSRYGTPIMLAAGVDPVALQLVDVDGDRRLDVVVGCAGDHTVRVFLNRSGTLASRPAQWAGVEVFPNPAHERLTLQLPVSLRGPVTATLRDALGRVVRQQAVAAPLATLSVADLSPGVYALQLSTAEGTMTQRVVVE